MWSPARVLRRTGVDNARTTAFDPNDACAAFAAELKSRISFRSPLKRRNCNRPQISLTQWCWQELMGDSWLLGSGAAPVFPLRRIVLWNRLL
jgi:hypothetical protein